MNDYAGHTDAALRALCAGATPGPWVSFADEPGALYTVASVGGGPDAAIEEVCREPEGDERIADMAFIAAARLALPATLDRVAALEAECARLREAFDTIEWMAERYAAAGGSHGPEAHDYQRALRLRNGEEARDE